MKDSIDIELYKTMVTTVTAAEVRRQKASGLYLSLLSGGFAALGIFEHTDPIFIVIPMVIISVVWLSSINYYKLIAKAKFQVISELESNWELKPFELEWSEFKKLRGGRGLRFGLTELEMFPPALISISGIFYLFFRLITYMCQQ